MASEISNIAALFCKDSTAAMFQTDKNAKVQSEFSTFLNASSFGQNTAKNCQTDANAATAGAATYDQYQYKAGASIKNACGRKISDEKLSAVKDGLGEFAEDVKNVLKEELEVTDEQIADAMTVLGLQFADLMEPKNLAALVTELTGCEEPMQLLMTDGFQEILGSVEEISNVLLDELGMSKEEFLAACDEILAQSAEQMQEETEMSQTVPVTGKNSDAAEVNTDVSSMTKVVTDRMTVAGKTAAEAVTVQDEAIQPEEPEQPAENVDVKTAEEQSAEDDGENAKPDQNFAEKSGKGTVEKYIQGHNNAVEQRVQQPVQAESFETTAQTPVQTYVDVQDIMEQISTYARIMTAGDSNVLEMQLNPENLGKIYIHVTEKAGTITAQISATNENVREALQAQVADLKANLNQQGIKVDAVEVTIENHEFEQNLEQNAGREQKRAEQEEQQRSVGTRRNINLADLDSLDGILTEEESLTAKIMQENGNQMDVTA